MVPLSNRNKNKFKVTGFYQNYVILRELLKSSSSFFLVQILTIAYNALKLYLLITGKVGINDEITNC